MRPLGSVPSPGEGTLPHRHRVAGNCAAKLSISCSYVCVCILRTHCIVKGIPAGKRKTPIPVGNGKSQPENGAYVAAIHIGFDP
uniref:IP03510p n=1 Tax=Drosophila melanogaster TaxID=7227 RepID=Q4V457_DROME|nr:IP03510p [Drosophila melanogaster]